MVDWVLELLKVYAELGAAALFLVLFLIAAVTLYKTLVRTNKGEEERSIKMATLAEQVVESMDQQSEILGQLKTSIDADKSATEKLHAWLQGNNDRNRERS